MDQNTQSAHIIISRFGVTKVNNISKGLSQGSNHARRRNDIGIEAIEQEYGVIPSLIRLVNLGDIVAALGQLPMFERLEIHLKVCRQLATVILWKRSVTRTVFALQVVRAELTWWPALIVSGCNGLSSMLVSEVS